MNALRLQWMNNIYGVTEHAQKIEKIIISSFRLALLVLIIF